MENSQAILLRDAFLKAGLGSKEANGLVMHLANECGEFFPENEASKAALIALNEELAGTLPPVEPIDFGFEPAPMGTATPAEKEKSARQANSRGQRVTEALRAIRQ